MKVVNLSEYFLKQVNEICRDKFENDVMLIYNNFTINSIAYITDNLKESIQSLSKMGMVFDNNIIKTLCSMYLGLAWSMHRKGKILQRDDKIISDLVIKDYCKTHISVCEVICDHIELTRIIDDISVRYYTLYFSQYLNDIYNRMQIIAHPYIENENSLKRFILEYLKIFGLKILANGIIEEYLVN